MNTRRWPARASTHTAVLTTSRGAVALHPARGSSCAKGLARRQGVGGCERVRRGLGVFVRRQHPRQRVERQPQAERRVATQRVQALTTQRPGAGDPVRRRICGRRHGFQRQHAARGPLEAGSEQPREARTFGGLRQVRLQRIDVDRQRRLVAQELRHVLPRRQHRRLGQPESTGERAQEAVGVLVRGAPGFGGVREARRIAPQRLAVVAPEDAECPARQRLARVPLALPVVQQRAGGEARREAAVQRLRERALRGRERRGVPLRPVHVVHRHERGLPALRETYVVRVELPVDGFAERVDRLPLRVGVGLRDPRILVDAGDVHVDGELGLADVGEADHRRRVAGIGRARERQVSFAGEESRGRIEADPARAREVGFRPGVEVREVAIGAGGTVERLHVGDELDQVARGEARRDAQVAQDLHEQPGAVAARAAAERQRFLGRLHARLHPHEVAGFLLQLLVQADQQQHGVLAGRDRRPERVEPAGKPRPRRRLLEKRDQFLGQCRRIGERELLGIGLDEEVEGIDDGEVRREVDQHLELLGRLGEHQPGEPVAVGILLPVEEVARRLDVERIAQHRRAAVRGRPQADLVRREAYPPVEAIGGAVVQRDPYRHGGLPRVTPTAGRAAARTRAAAPPPTACAPSGSTGRPRRRTART